MTKTIMDGDHASDRSADARASNRENGVLARIALAAAIIAIGVVVAKALYVNWERYDKMAFGLYYTWWKEFADGLDPWRAETPCLYPPAFVIAFSPLTRLGQVWAYRIWQGGQVMAFFPAVFLMMREAGSLTIARLAATG